MVGLVPSNANLLQTSAANGFARWVGDVEEGDFEVLCEFIRDAVQRVRGADEEIGSGALGRLGFG